jgi:rhodanese-related sulfurtransferase
MQFLIDNWSLVLLAVVSGAGLLIPSMGQISQVGSITPAEVVTLMNRQKAVVIDVSDRTDFETGHINGAKHVVMSDLQAKLDQVVKNKKLPLVFVCAKGNAARKAQQVAQRLGFEQTHVLGGGMQAWVQAQLPTLKAA